MTSSAAGGAPDEAAAPTGRPLRAERFPAPPPSPSDTKLRLWIAGVVTVVWACSFVADVIPSLDYNPPQAIHGAMLLVVGGIFGTEIRRRK